MYVTVLIEGVNLERLMKEAVQAGVVIRRAQRKGVRAMQLCVHARQLALLEKLCAQSGWTCRRIHAGMLIGLAGLLRARPMLAPALMLSMLLVMLSSKTILAIRIEGAGEHTAQVRRVLAEDGVHPGKMMRAVSLDALRAHLAYRLPGLAYAGAYYAGSTLIIDCRGAVQEERPLAEGAGGDIVAAKSGIISRIWVSAGTPQVEPGQAVHQGQVLISGYERSEKGTQIPVRARGQVFARIYAAGEARVSLHEMRSTETGRRRTRVILKTPWTAHVVRDAQPFDSQEIERRRERVVGLYLPLWREIETYVETEVFRDARNRTDCASMAQGAAEKIARKQCPPDALILDKWVNYSMIDNEFVYASVVLEMEAPIAGRIP